MRIPSGTRPRSLSAAAILLALTTPAMATPAEPGVSHELAIARATRISDLHYNLTFTLKEHASEVAATETLTFLSSTAGDLPIDYRDGTLQSATLNAHPIPINVENGHLNLPAIAGRNTLTIAFTSDAAPAGKSITRYEDKDDGSEYIYTLFVPMDASMAFPCFDQPDLKARFTLEVNHPANWTVIANTAPTRNESTSATHTQFPETHPISTYLFAFAAGPFLPIHAQNLAEPTVYVRKSQLARAQQEAPQVQQMAARGIAYFAELLCAALPVPQVRSRPHPRLPLRRHGACRRNLPQRRRRPLPLHTHRQATTSAATSLVLHETCHQWFGDLVTMRWFDDLWLKEGFAQYMAYKALAQLEPASNPWKHFYEDIKPLAYGIDETQGTTPIFQNIRQPQRRQVRLRSHRLPESPSRPQAAQLLPRRRQLPQRPAPLSQRARLRQRPVVRPGRTHSKPQANSWANQKTSKAGPPVGSPIAACPKSPSTTLAAMARSPP